MSKTKRTFEEVLKRSNKDIKSDKSARLALSTSMSFKAKADGLVKEIFDLEDSLDEMMDISASNVTTTSNRVANKFDSVAFVDKRSALLLKKVILKQKLDVLIADADFYNVEYSANI